MIRQCVLQRSNGAASGQVMLRRIASLVVLFGLLFSVVAMPAIAHASDGSALAVAMIEAQTPEDPGSQSSDSGTPCHAASHHHCNMALHLAATQIKLTGLNKSLLVFPAADTTLVSHSQAPPLEPPAA